MLDALNARRVMLGVRRLQNMDQARAGELYPGEGLITNMADVDAPLQRV